MSGLAVTKHPEESWRECVERYAKPYGLEEEALADFDRGISLGTDEDSAAFNALYEWDLLDFSEESKKEEGTGE